MIAMTYGGYVAAGWSVALLSIGAFALRTLRRGRALAERVPAGERRWT